MFGLDYKKAPPTIYVILHQDGQIRRQGPGINFWYFTPVSTVVDVPLTSQDIPFIFTETTADFQELSLQGQLTYKITEPVLASSMLNFAVNTKGVYIETQDNPLELLGARLVNATQVIAQAVIRPLTLRTVLQNPQAIVAGILNGLRKADSVKTLGTEILDLSIIAIRPTPETARALESETREKIQQQSDQAIYTRRNAAVEEERRIKESELNTEKAVEQKRREIRETKMAADIALEAQRTTLIDTKIENDKKDADSKAYALETSLAPVRQTDWRTLLALAAKGGDSRFAMALAFQELAENANKIGQLTITPELLGSLMPPPDPHYQVLEKAKK